MPYLRALLGFAVLLSAIPSAAEDVQRRISVVGAADVRVQPDYVVISMGVETKSPALSEAKRANDACIKRVLSFLKQSRVAPADTKTDFLAIVPVFRLAESTVADHYLVQRSIIVTVRQLQKFEAILNGSIARGITNVHGIDFRTSQLKLHRETARELAILAAGEKAEKLAGGLGGSVGLPLTIDDTSWGGVSSWSSNYWGQRDRAYSSQVSYTPGGAADEPAGPVALGQILVSASVRVTFALE
jgi:uncharacterized protein YggE